VSGWQSAVDSIERDRFVAGRLPCHRIQAHEEDGVNAARGLNTAGVIIGAFVWTGVWVLGIGYAIGWLSF
jgi:hypothetical protein